MPEMHLSDRDPSSSHGPSQIPQLQPPELLEMGRWETTKRAIRGKFERWLKIVALAGGLSALPAYPASKTLEDFFEPDQTSAALEQKKKNEKHEEDDSVLGYLKTLTKKLSDKAAAETINQFEQIETIKTIKETLELYEKTKNTLREYSLLISWAAIFLIIYKILNKAWPEWEDPAMKSNIETLARHVQAMQALMNQNPPQLSAEQQKQLRSELESSGNALEKIIKFVEK